jgi:uncharacterized protein YndB with AHSA1/START domain
VVIQASPETVFRFFTDNARWSSWWGAGSTNEPRVGGAVYIRHPNGVENSGTILSIDAPQRIEFTYGYPGGKPFGPDQSKVVIRLEAAGAATRLTLHHEFEDATSRDGFIQGWRYQLSVFSNGVADEVHAGSEGIVDTWFGLWTVADDAERGAIIERLAGPSVTFRDRYSMLEGHEDLRTHIGASQRFMPGLKMERRGSVKHCQGTVLAEWAAVGADGGVRMSGTNVFQFGPDGKLASVTGVQQFPSSDRDTSH